MIQGGDPKGNGSGGPGYQFPNEISADLKHDGPGVLAMANSGPNTNGSQFYITMQATPQLDGGYSVFGRVVQGQEVVAKIARGDRMTTVKILRVGADAQAFTVTQAGFDAMVASAKAAVAEKSRRDREAALAAIAKKYPELTTTTSGLQYKVLKQGSGAEPRGRRQRDGPLHGLAAGRHEVRQLEGRRRPRDVPDRRGHRGVERGAEVHEEGRDAPARDPSRARLRRARLPGVIPGNAFLVFEVELISF